jgi:hypothetical protein
VRLPLLTVIFAAVAGCSTLHRATMMKQVMDPYIGHPLSDVAARFGPPGSNFPTADNGQMTFQWNHFSPDQPPAMAAVAAGAPPLPQIDCRMWVSALPTYGDASTAVLSSWIVQSWDSYGSDCR